MSNLSGLLENDFLFLSNNSITTDMFLNKSFLITGATGLIGRYMIEYLIFLNKMYNCGIKIYAVSRSRDKLSDMFGNHTNLFYIEQDLLLPISNKTPKVDYVIHGASNTHPVQYATDPIGTIETTYQGTKNVLDYCILNNINKLIYLSTVEIYGEPDTGTSLIPEDYLGFIKANTLRAGYPESKRLAESLIVAYSEKFGINAVIARISRVFGPTVIRTDSKAINQFIFNAVEGKDIVLKSSGKQQYSYVYVGDVVNAVLTLIIKGQKNEAYNVAIPKFSYDLLTIAKSICSKYRLNLIFDIPHEVEAKGFSVVTKALLDTKKIESLGWKSIFPFEKSIISTIETLKMLNISQK